MNSISCISKQKISCRVDRVNDGDIPPILLSDDFCKVTLQKWNVEMKFDRPNLILVFRIEDVGDHHHEYLLKYYTVEVTRIYKRKGKPNRINFKSSWRRDWAKQFVRLFGEQEKNTDDFLNPDRLADHVLLVSLRTKKTDSKGLIPEEEWESKVDEILEISA